MIRRSGLPDPSLPKKQRLTGFEQAAEFLGVAAGIGVGCFCLHPEGLDDLVAAGFQSDT